MEATFADTTVEIVVRDQGRWRDPRGVNRGRGLPLMEALMDTVDVNRGDQGSTIVLRRALGVAGR